MNQLDALLDVEESTASFAFTDEAVRGNGGSPTYCLNQIQVRILEMHGIKISGIHAIIPRRLVLTRSLVKNYARWLKDAGFNVIIVDEETASKTNGQSAVGDSVVLISNPAGTLTDRAARVCDFSRSAEDEGLE